MNFLKNKFAGKGSDAADAGSVNSSSSVAANTCNTNNDSNNNNNHDSDDDNDLLTFDLATDGASKRVYVVKDASLLQIGKEIKQLEAECRLEDDRRSKAWEINDAKKLRESVKQLDEEIALLQKRVKSESKQGFDHIQQLENLLGSHMSKQDEVKRKLYFPTSNIALGNDGAYFALDDFWLEHASGSFELSVSPGNVHGEKPKILLSLDGSSRSESVDGGEAGGVSIRLKIGGFKLKGDMGKGIPPLSLDYIKVTTTVRVHIVLTFDKDKKLWTASPEDFKVEILYFKGPFGLSRGVVVAALSVALPFVRRAVLAGLPPELGMFIATIPSPLIIKGEFNIHGVVLKQMSHGMYKSSNMCAVIGYTSDQLLKFVGIQKSIDRGVLIKSMQDMLQYRRLAVNHPEKWAKLCSLWGDASVIYFDKSPNNQPGDVPFSFERLLQGAAEVLKNPLTVQFSLLRLCGSIRLHKILEHVQKRVDRWHLELTETELLEDKPELVFLMKKVQHRLESAWETLHQLKQNLDFMNIKLGMNVTSGPLGNISLKFQNLVAQAPVAVWSAIPKDLTGGWLTPVPFIIDTQAEEDGSLEIHLEHLGSSELLTLSNYRTRKTQGEESAAGGSRRSSGWAAGRRTTASMDAGGGNISAILAAATNNMQGAAGSAAEKTGKVYVVPAVGSTLDNTSKAVVSAAGTVSASIDHSARLVSTATDKVSAWSSNLAAADGHRPQFGAALEKPKQVTIRQEHSHLSSADRLKRDLDRIRAQQLAPDQSESVLRALVTQPNISVIIDKAMTLQPGASLLSMRLGPVEQDWKPLGFDGNAGALQLRRTSTVSDSDSGAGGSGNSPVPSTPQSVHSEAPGKTPAAATATATAPQAVQLPGCPIMVQTSPHIKVLVQVPDIELDIYLAHLFRFIYAYIGDVELLIKTLGLVEEQEVRETRQHVQFSLFLLERLEKYVLIPHLNMSVNLSVKMNQRTDQDDVVFSMDDVGSLHAVELTGRFNVYDLFKDGWDTVEMLKTVYVDVEDSTV